MFEYNNPKRNQNPINFRRKVKLKIINFSTKDHFMAINIVQNICNENSYS
jgi:hypothetical protein